MERKKTATPVSQLELDEEYLLYAASSVKVLGRTAKFVTKEGLEGSTWNHVLFAVEMDVEIATKRGLCHANVDFRAVVTSFQAKPAKIASVVIWEIFERHHYQERSPCRLSVNRDDWTEQIIQSTSSSYY